MWEEMAGTGVREVSEVQIAGAPVGQTWGCDPPCSGTDPLVEMALLSNHVVSWECGTILALDAHVTLHSLGMFNSNHTSIMAT